MEKIRSAHVRISQAVWWNCMFSSSMRNGMHILVNHQ